MSDALNPELRFSLFNQEWNKSLIGSLMSVTSVKRVLQSDWTQQGVRFLRARDIVALSKNDAVSDMLFISHDMYDKYSQMCGKVSRGDLLVTGVGTIGVPMLIRDDTPIYFKDGNIIWFKNEQKIDGLFFYYSFINRKTQNFIKESAGTGTVGTYTIETGRKTPITLTTIEEQSKIGAYFRDLDKRIQQQESKIEKLQKMKKAFLSRMFPEEGADAPVMRFDGYIKRWVLGRLSDMMTCYSGGTPKVSIKEYYHGDIPFIRSGEIGAEQTEMFLSSIGLASSSAKFVTKGTLLYALYGATSGEVSISKINGAINQAILAIEVFSDVDCQFLYFWLQRKKALILGTYLQGGQGNLSANIVKNLFVCAPSYAEQQKVGSLLHQLDTLINLHQQKLTKLKNLKSAFLEKMFV